MSELNDAVNVTVDDATVITVPLVTNLTATNAAPTAKTVGDALAAKVDTAHIMESVVIKVNDEQSDNQGQILIDGTGIPITEGSTTTIADAVEAVDGKTAADIVYDSADPTTSIKAKVDAINTELAGDIEDLDAKTGEDIAMGGTDSTPIKTAIDNLAQTVAGIDTGTDNVKYTAQTLDDTQKGVARTNIGAASATDVTAIQTEMSGKYPTTLPYEAKGVSDDYPLPPVDLGLATRHPNSCALYRFGALVMVSFFFESTSTIPAGTKIAGFYGGYEVATNMLCIAQITPNGGGDTIPLYRDGDGVSTPAALPVGTWRGFILYGVNNSIWPIAT